MSQTTSYDVQNRTVSVTDFEGETTTSQYDQLDRVLTTTFPDGSSQSYTYTSSGQIASVSGPQGTSRYSYESDGRLLSVTDPNGAAVSYSYDALGRKTSVTAPSGTTEYDYDEFGRLVSVTDPDGNETRYTYDEHGNKTSMVYPNGTITEYDYDNLNRLIAVETRNITGTLLASYSYTLNTKGQRIHVEEQPTGRLIDYDYDAADRLIEEDISDPVLGNRTISYSYDPVGNRLTKDDNGVVTAYTYDDNDRLLTENGLSYTYDDNGNMLTKSGNGETWQLAYNALNQLVHANISTPQGSSNIDYAYDHDGIRIGKTINGINVIHYVVDKNRPYAQVLEEERTNGMLRATTSYVYGDALLSSTTEGLTHYYHADGMGSTRLLSDASGNVSDTYSYDAYGMLQHYSGTSENPYLYRGEQYDADVNSYYLRARFYRLETGRFLTTDPEEGMMGDPFSAHRYLYAYDNPINNIDPSGKITLNDVMTSVAIISNLSALSLGIVSSVNENFADTLAEYMPDAGLIGVSGFFGVKEIQLINKFLAPTPFGLGAFPSVLDMNYGIRGGFIGGLDIVFSISSGQYGFYLYGGFQGEFGLYQKPANWGITLYHGWVWNLWNTYNYTGPFWNLNLPGVSLFKDAKHSLDKGPFGMSFPCLSYPPGKSISVGLAYTKYKDSFYREFKAPGGMPEVTTTFTVSLMVMMGLAFFEDSPYGLMTSAASLSWPYLILQTKEIWNKRRPKWNMEKRRMTPERPEGFSSGVKQWIFW